LPPEDIQQNSNPADRIDPLEPADQFRERAINDLNPLARLDVPVPMNRAFIVAVLLQALDDAQGKRCGQIALHHQACHAVGAINASPPVSGQVKSYEQVTREERHQHGLNPPRMPASLAAAGKEHRKVLIFQVSRRPGFPVRQALDCIPPRTWPRAKLGGCRLAPAARIARVLNHKMNGLGSEFELPLLLRSYSQ
jgi:hypothetical protein